MRSAPSRQGPVRAEALAPALFVLSDSYSPRQRQGDERGFLAASLLAKKLLI